MCAFPGCGRVFYTEDRIETFCSRRCLRDYNYPFADKGWRHEVHIHEDWLEERRTRPHVRGQIVEPPPPDRFCHWEREFATPEPESPPRRKPFSIRPDPHAHAQPRSRPARGRSRCATSTRTSTTPASSPLPSTPQAPPQVLHPAPVQAKPKTPTHMRGASEGIRGFYDSRREVPGRPSSAGNTPGVALHKPLPPVVDDQAPSQAASRAPQHAAPLAPQHSALRAPQPGAPPAAQQAVPRAPPTAAPRAPVPTLPRAPQQPAPQAAHYATSRAPEPAPRRAAQQAAQRTPEPAPLRVDKHPAPQAAQQAPPRADHSRHGGSSGGSIASIASSQTLTTQQMSRLSPDASSSAAPTPRSSHRRSNSRPLAVYIADDQSVTDPRVWHFGAPPSPTHTATSGDTVQSEPHGGLYDAEGKPMRLEFDPGVDRIVMAPSEWTASSTTLAPVGGHAHAESTQKPLAPVYALAPAALPQQQQQRAEPKQTGPVELVQVEKFHGVGKDGWPIVTTSWQQPPPRARAQAQALPAHKQTTQPPIYQNPPSPMAFHRRTPSSQSRLLHHKGALAQALPPPKPRPTGPLPPPPRPRSNSFGGFRFPSDR
ncbi:hypothetical protein BD413DRAFT_625945 [Trametes elegans]|nr:hypothetical protein BD413DRAFT_625945 [Trametes elegans]